MNHKTNVSKELNAKHRKSNIVSPFAVHQQQLAMLAQAAQQQSLLMSAATKASGGTPKLPNNSQLGLNGTNLPTQNWPNMGYQFPGVIMPATGKIEMDKYMQMGNLGTTHPIGNSYAFPMTSICAAGPNVSSNGSVASAAGKQTAASHSSGSSKAGNEYDFSSLTQGFFSKQ